jgi:hypothetical protein
MAMSEIRKLGLDPGFGNVNVAEVQNGEITAVGIPSVVGIGSMDAGALTLAGVVRGGRRQRPARIAFDGIEYLVGPGVAEHARPIERMDFQRFSDSPELRALLYAALYQVLNGGGHQVALAVGLPVEILQDTEQAQAAERGMARWLVGEHRFELDDTPARFEVVAMRAKIAQPVATWFDWGMDNAGQWVRGGKLAKAPALIIDQGFNTLDVLVVENGRISTRYTSGDTLGMRRAAELAAGNIQRRYGVEMSLHEADELVQAVVHGKRVTIFVEGESTNVTREVRQALSTLGSDVVRFVERSVGKAARKFKVFLTGGGSMAIGERLLGQYAHAVMVDDPVLANARGLAKLAQRPGFLV